MLRGSVSRLAEHAAPNLSMAALRSKPKPEGDISSVFASLSNEASQPLPDRFRKLKREIVGDNESAVYESWKSLIPALKDDVELIKRKGNEVIPVVDFKSLKSLPETDRNEIRHRGVCVVKGVFSTEEALRFKKEAKRYIESNPSTKGFPADQPQVYELYWSPSQIQARADSRMLSLQSFFLSLWHNRAEPSIATSTPLTYADRFRIRVPGDSKFALGPHVDGGGLERWEDPTYRSCYAPILEGRWEQYDPFEIGGRASRDLNMSMYDCPGGCNIFRAWQGWLSMSSTRPSEGTLRVLPLTKTSTAYWLLRPFFSPKSSSISASWEFTPDIPYLHGANPGRGQEMSNDLHPHLELGESMVSVPKVEPGDAVMWQGDLIHAVESIHAGKSDSSVMYIPAAPDTPLNRAYIQYQREAFLAGLPPPDFPGGKGESEHVGRGTKEMIFQVGGEAALAAMGF